MKTDDFFIGWKDQMPVRSGKPVRILVMAILTLTTLLTVLFVLAQKPYNNHFFNLGNTVDITGVYYDRPVPILMAQGDQFEQELSNTVMLVGFGKFGAEKVMGAIQGRIGSLSGKTITLSGTLIHGDGQTLMELTKGENSLVQVSSERPTITSLIEAGPLTELTGEVLDPKCYFGVMKPGEGKIHKSCATRCISGGIPPVLRHETSNSDRPYEYYILLDTEGNRINQAILPYVAEIIQITGVASKIGDWNILYGDLNTIKNSGHSLTPLE